MDTISINHTTTRCKKALASYYGKRFKGLILYGSMARADAEVTSDIDLLILLAAPFDYFAEMRAIVDLLYPIQLETDQLISAKPAPVGDYEIGRISIYRTIQREGVAV
jgi:uncharacterized protein